MSSVRRVYVEKKPDFAVQAKDLKHEIHSYLGISEVTGVRVLIRYDVEHISDEVFEKGCRTVFSEPPVDTLYRESFKTGPSDRVFSVEFLPGQFDQRADSAVQCVKFLKEDEEPIIKSATTYVIEGNITDEQFEAIKNHCINPVDSRETGMEKPETLETHFDEPEDVKIFDGFQDMPEEELKKLYDSLNLAMTFKDFLHIQNYYKNEEKRDPSVTEIRVLDTYWSDHCRHTTFSTELKNVTFGDGDYRKPVQHICFARNAHMEAPQRFAVQNRGKARKAVLVIGNVRSAQIAVLAETVGQRTAFRAQANAPRARIVAPCDAPAVFRNEGDVFGKCLLDMVEIVEIIQMIGVDIQNHRDRWMKMQEARMKFARFNDEILAAAATRGTSDEIQLAADVNRRVFSGG